MSITSLTACGSGISVRGDNITTLYLVADTVTGNSTTRELKYSHIIAKNQNGDIIVDELGPFEGKEKKGQFTYEDLTTGKKSSINLKHNTFSVEELTYKEYKEMSNE